MNRTDTHRAALSGVPSEAPAAMVLDLARLRKNYRALRACSAPAGISAVVKADAYGLGAAAVVPALSAEGCASYFVATLDEARAVRTLAPASKVYVLDGLFPGTAAAFHATGAMPVLGSVEEAYDWAEFCRAAGERLPAAIHIDTGMNRLGLAAGDIPDARAISSAFEVSCVMSHLACAEEPDHAMNAVQRTRFADLAPAFPSGPKSLANSAGIALGSSFHFDLTRPGIALYRGVVSVYARIAQIRWVAAGETVGYGAAETCRRRTRIASVCAGYADGYIRALSASDSRAGPPGAIEGGRIPLIGRVSMDCVTFDVTDVPDSVPRRGGWLQLAGDDVSIEDLAAVAGTIPYELLTRLGGRCHRIYV